MLTPEGRRRSALLVVTGRSGIGFGRRRLHTETVAQEDDQVQMRLTRAPKEISFFSIRS
jgi:hypothetical protein